MRRPQPQRLGNEPENVRDIDEKLEFHQYIKKWRERKSMNQQALATAARLSGAYITLIEQEKKLPSEKACVQLAQALGRPAVEVIERVRRAREKKNPEVAQAMAYELTPVDPYNEDINRFLDAYRKLSDGDKRLVEQMLSPLTKLMEGKMKAT